MAGWPIPGKPLLRESGPREPVCVALKQLPHDLQAAQGIQCGHAADNRLSKLKAVKR